MPDEITKLHQRISELEERQIKNEHGSTRSGCGIVALVMLIPLALWLIFTPSGFGVLTSVVRAFKSAIGAE